VRDSSDQAYFCLILLTFLHLFAKISKIFDINILDMNLIDIGQSVRKHRIALRLTQAAVAQLAGVSRATLNALETGFLSELGVTRLMRILATVGLSLTVMPASSRRPTLDDRYAEQAANAR